MTFFGLHRFRQFRTPSDSLINFGCAGIKRQKSVAPATLFIDSLKPLIGSLVPAPETAGKLRFAL